MVTSSIVVAAFAVIKMVAGDGLTVAPSSSPTEPPTAFPTTECGLELALRKRMPSCQLMHGDKKSCEGSYVLFSIPLRRGNNEFREWAEPCMFWENDKVVEGGACLPFPPCFTEDLDQLTAAPSHPPTQPPTTECGLELPLRTRMPSCQLMHGDKESCERAYVLFSLSEIMGTNQQHEWAEPCMYWENEDEACLPFPPCFSEDVDMLSGTPSLAPSVAPTQSPTTECGLELESRKKMPSCQLMHGQGKQICESAYVLFTVGLVTKSEPYSWVEPCAYYDQEGGVCLPFPPCMKEVNDSGDFVPLTTRTRNPTQKPTSDPTPTPSEEDHPCETMFVGDYDGMFNGTFVLQQEEPHKGQWWRGRPEGVWWKDATTGYEIYYNYEGIYEGRWSMAHPRADSYAVSEEIPPFDGRTQWQVRSYQLHFVVDKFIDLWWECATSSPTIEHTYSPTFKPTMAPTIVPTLAPTLVPTLAAQTDCASQSKAKCKNTEGCRFVNNRKGCQIRIRPCSFLSKKNQCKNSHGCKWGKKSRVCEEAN